jgi:hypothetical protein
MNTKEYFQKILDISDSLTDEEFIRLIKLAIDKASKDKIVLPDPPEPMVCKEWFGLRMPIK